MTSSTSPALPPAPVLRMRDPGELLAALPYLLGFHPRDSLVVLAFGGRSGRRVGLTQRVDLPPPEHVAAVCAALAGNVRHSRAAGAAVLVVGGGDPPAGGAGPPRAELAAAATEALQDHGVPVRMRAWSGGTGAGAPWSCYDECRCAGALPDPAATPLAATAVAAGVLVHADRAELHRLVAPVAADVLRRRERLLTRAVDAELRSPGEQGGPGPGPDGIGPDGIGPDGIGPDGIGPDGIGSAEAVVDAALADAASGRLRLDDGRVLALALALADPLVRDAALVRCAVAGAESAEQLWAALARETPDPEAAEPAALLAACALLRGDGALAGIALDRAEQAWPGHRLTGLLRAAWQAGMSPDQVRECLRSAPLPPAVRARLRRRGGRR